MRYYGRTENGVPITQWPKVHETAAKYERFIVTVEKYTPEKEASMLQFAYLHAVVFPTLAKEWNCSLAEAELICKRRWGEQWLIRTEMGYRFVLSKTILTTKQCTQWIENIWEGAHGEGLLIPPPDKDWRKTRQESNHETAGPCSAT